MVQKAVVEEVGYGCEKNITPTTVSITHILSIARSHLASLFQLQIRFGTSLRISPIQ